MGNIFAYMRISTKEDREMQKFSRQEVAIDRYAEENNLTITLKLKEDKSGKTFAGRTEWERMESLLHEGDTIIIKDISRFSRNVDEGVAKYLELMDEGVDLVFLDNFTLSTSYTRNLLDIAKREKNNGEHLLSEVQTFLIRILLISELERAEKERTTLIKRIKDGIQASDKTQGRKVGQLDKLTPELEADIKKYLSDRTITQTDLMKKHKISRNTLKKYIQNVAETEEQ